MGIYYELYDLKLKTFHEHITWLDKNTKYKFYDKNGFFDLDSSNTEFKFFNEDKTKFIHISRGAWLCYIDVIITPLEEWPTNHVCHRYDHPSFFSSGTAEFFINDKTVAYKHNNKWHGEFYDWTIQQDIDIDNITDDDVDLIKMVWG